MHCPDSGQTYTSVKTTRSGTSGNFNGYGDLGTPLPRAPADPAGLFRTLVGCNDCPGGALTRPAFLQTWQDTYAPASGPGAAPIRLVGNASATYSGFPPGFAAPGAGMSTPAQSIVRTKDGALLMAVYGYSADSSTMCRSGGQARPSPPAPPLPERCRQQMDAFCSDLSRNGRCINATAAAYPDALPLYALDGPACGGMVNHGGGNYTCTGPGAPVEWRCYSHLALTPDHSAWGWPSAPHPNAMCSEDNAPLRDIYRKCTGHDPPAPPPAPKRCYTTAFFKSTDGGHHWAYSSRIDQTAAMPAAVEGPCEPSMAVLADGRVLAVFRLQSDVPLWKAYSEDSGGTWSEPQQMQAANASQGAAIPHAVWPQLLVLSNGLMVLASGRSGIGFWSSTNGDGEYWVYHDVQQEHNRLYPADQYTAGHDSTTSYTGIAEVEPGMVLLSYDKWDGGGWPASPVQKVYNVLISVQQST
eukprot:gene8877-224_t